MSSSGSVGASTGTSYLLNLRNETVDLSGVTLNFAADFEAIDPAATGVITLSEFQQAFASLRWPEWLKAGGAEAMFAQLDPQATGRVQHDDFVAGMTSLAAALAPPATDTPDTPSSSTTAAPSSGLSGISLLLAGAFAPPATDRAESETAAAPVAAEEDVRDEALMQFYSDVFTRIAPADGSNVLTQADIEQGFDELQLPQRLRAFSATDIFRRLDPFATGEVSRENFVRDMTDLVALAKHQEATAAAAAADTMQNSGNRDFAGMFASIDVEEAGSITLQQFERTFDSLAVAPAIAQIGADAIFRLLGPDATGRVSAASFKSNMSSLAEALDYFYEIAGDVDRDGNGLITLEELREAFNWLDLPSAVMDLGPDAVYAQIDPFYTHQVSVADFVEGMIAVVAQSAPRAAAPYSMSDSELFLRSFYAGGSDS